MYPLANGKHQSPINILTDIAIFDDELIKPILIENYEKHCCDELMNNGHTFQINCHHGSKNSIFENSKK